MVSIKSRKRSREPHRAAARCCSRRKRDSSAGRGIEKIIRVGFVANTCIEGTARFGMELGYRVTLVRDATAAFEPEGLHAAHEVNDLASRTPFSPQRLLALLLVKRDHAAVAG
ncbi:MAG TPA: isochorismatase family protein [Candidatus Acidoferrales bacterium]|nr:isochorismatase family protein [Candidatus Acidoferrales bacterium]